MLSKKLKRIFIHGGDKIGWSIDSDRKNIINFLNDIGFKLSNNPLTANVIHSVYWSQLLSHRDFFLSFLKKPIITTATNFIVPDNNIGYQKIKNKISLWIAPSWSQFELLSKDGVNVAYQPFYVDENIFHKSQLTKREISQKLSIDYSLIENKILFGSFQRDTIGQDLITPKWQKGPEKLLNILELLPNKNDWLLVLCGPRRHYLINECKKRKIPFIFLGQIPKPGIDDLFINKFDYTIMPLLYNLIDCYLVSSESEGGPKAVLEACFCKTMILSTKVGFAPDFLHPKCLFENPQAAANIIVDLFFHNNLNQELIDYNYLNTINIGSYVPMLNRWKSIYEQF